MFNPDQDDGKENGAKPIRPTPVPLPWRCDEGSNVGTFLFAPITKYTGCYIVCFRVFPPRNATTKDV